MLFMIIYTYEPGQRNETTKRRLHQEKVIPKEMKVIGEWSFLVGDKGFMLLEVQDSKLLLKAFSAWSDLLKFEVFPVIETEEVMKLANKYIAEGERGNIGITINKERNRSFLP